MRVCRFIDVECSVVAERRRQLPKSMRKSISTSKNEANESESGHVTKNRKMETGPLAAVYVYVKYPMAVGRNLHLSFE